MVMTKRKRYYELYANKFENIDKMDTFLELKTDSGRNRKP